MIKKLQGQKAKIAILIALIVTALAEVLFRAIAVGEAALSTANAGEQITLIVLAAIILFFAAKKNDKLAYVSCGALVAYFVMDQLFELPGMIENLLANIAVPTVAISIGLRLLTMLGIVAISALLVEYVNDGSIYNRAYNIIYWATILLHVASIAFCVVGMVLFGGSADASNAAEFAVLQKQSMLIIFNDAYRIIMVILFTTFAYDSAKRQLEREKLAK